MLVNIIDFLKLVDYETLIILNSLTYLSTGMIKSILLYIFLEERAEKRDFLYFSSFLIKELHHSNFVPVLSSLLFFLKKIALYISIDLNLSFQKQLELINEKKY